MRLTCRIWLGNIQVLILWISCRYRWDIGEETMESPTRQMFGIMQGEYFQAFKLLRGPYSQQELADKLELDQGTVVKWETGECTPSPKNVRLLLLHAREWAKALDLRLIDVLELATTITTKP